MSALHPTLAGVIVDEGSYAALHGRSVYSRELRSTALTGRVLASTLGPYLYLDGAIDLDHYDQAIAMLADQREWLVARKSDWIVLNMEETD